MEPSPKVSPLKRNFRVLKLAYETSPAFCFACLFEALISSILPFVALYGSNLIIDKIIAGASFDSIMLVVYIVAGIAALGGILLAIIFFLRDALAILIKNKINQRISEKSFSLSYEQIEDHDVMVLLTMAEEGSNGSGDISNFVRYFEDILKNLLSVVYAVILVYGLFTTSNSFIASDTLGAFLNGPSTGLILLAEVFILLFVNIMTMTHLNKLSYETMMNNIDSNRRYGYFYQLTLNYSLGKDIRLYHMQPMIDKEERDPKNGVNGTWNIYSWQTIKINSLTTLCSGILLVSAYALIGLKAMYKQISIGTVVSNVGSITLLATSLVALVTSQGQMNLCSEYLNNYFTFLNLPSSITYGTKSLDESKPITISFKDVYFTYPGQATPTLKGLNLTIKPGERLALVGLNGAGKSTLVKLLCRFYDPDKGEVLLNGTSIKEYSEESIFRLYAVVFQDFKLFSYSIRENIYCGKEGDEAKAIDALKRAGIYERISKMKDGLDTIIYNKNDENGVEISGGEAQKIAIARALYKDSPIVVLDEPTSALDPKSEADIYDKFAQLVKGKTAVFISHRMSSTRDSDEIAVIKDGAVVELGNHKDLMKIKDGLYKQMWEAQAQYYK